MVSRGFHTILITQVIDLERITGSNSMSINPPFQAKWERAETQYVQKFSGHLTIHHMHTSAVQKLFTQS